jgi:hypothetical protein
MRSRLWLNSGICLNQAQTMWKWDWLDIYKPLKVLRRMEERRRVSEIRMKNDENHAKIWVRSMQNFHKIEEFVNQSLMVEAMPIKWLIYQLKC